MNTEPVSKIVDLMLKYLQEDLNEEEKIRLESWRQESDENRLLFNELMDDVLLTEELKVFKSAGTVNARKKLHRKIHGGSVFYMRHWVRYAAAAAVLIIVGSGYWLITNSKPEIAVATASKKNILIADIAPPNISNAVLTLSNGQHIILDSVGNGSLARQLGVNLVKLSDGEIEYQPDKGTGKAKGELLYNSVTNPRGSKVVNITLGDGTRVWLNAESSLLYPVSFTGNERKVEISGEAYFEVAHNAAQPFIVRKGNAEVKVLGTHFNMNTYEDEEKIKVTLLEGRVMIKKDGDLAYLNPGQQGIIQGKKSSIGITDNVDMEAVMAWKNGQFVLDGTDVKVLMQQVSRWYNVDIVYKGTVGKRSFGGVIDRDVPLSRVIQALRENEVHCKLDGRTITIGN